MPLIIGPDDYCPFLTCLQLGPHSHPVCTECAAVNYGNLFCGTCREHWPEVDAEIQRTMANLKDRP